jgi:hypothetical protein
MKQLIRLKLIDLLCNLTYKKLQIKSHVVFPLCFNRRNVRYFNKNDTQAKRLAQILVTREKGYGGGRRAV